MDGGHTARIQKHRDLPKQDGFKTGLFFHRKPKLLYMIPNYRRLTREDEKHENERY